MSYMPSIMNMAVNIKRKRRTAEEVRYWEKRNKELAAEYKTASPERRREIFQEYWDGNSYFLSYWGKWEREHWAELTQIFVSYWHEAFMRYNPTSEKSVFNFYMQRVYMAKASQEYKQWLKHERNVGLELEYQGEGKEGKLRKELFIHPQSEWDIALLRSKLSRNLDKDESKILDEYFFGDRKLAEIRKEDTTFSPTGFLKRYEKMLDKMVLNISKEELYESATAHRDIHPLNIIGKRAPKENRLRINGERVKVAA